MRSGRITDTEKLFKTKLRQLRELHGYSKYAIAKMLGISYSYYHNIENEEKKVMPNFEVMEKIAEIYQVGVSDLYQE